MQIFFILIYSIYSDFKAQFWNIRTEGHGQLSRQFVGLLGLKMHRLLTWVNHTLDKIFPPHQI